MSCTGRRIAPLAMIALECVGTIERDDRSAFFQRCALNGVAPWRLPRMAEH